MDRRSFVLGILAPKPRKTSEDVLRDGLREIKSFAIEQGQVFTKEPGIPRRGTVWRMFYDRADFALRAAERLS